MQPGELTDTICGPILKWPHSGRIAQRVPSRQVVAAKMHTSGQPISLLLNSLRQETRPLHRVLEANPRMKKLVAPRLRLDEYGTILVRFSRHLQNHLGIGPDNGAAYRTFDRVMQ